MPVIGHRRESRGQNVDGGDLNQNVGLNRIKTARLVHKSCVTNFWSTSFFVVPPQALLENSVF